MPGISRRKMLWQMASVIGIVAAGEWMAACTNGVIPPVNTPGAQPTVPFTKAGQMIKIDAHQHVWDMKRFRYSWLTPDSPVLYRNRLPDDVLPEMQKAGIEAAVLVQADGSVEEAYWLLELAGKYNHISGVVGWADLAAPDLPAILAALTAYPGFKGVRPSIDARQDMDELRPGLQILDQYRLACDLLISPEQLHDYLRLLSDYPNITFVFDHLANSFGAPGDINTWKDWLKPVAALPNTVMKVSGYLTAAKTKPLTPQVLRPYVITGLELFGSTRLLYGSDWPVCTLAGSYADTVAILRSVTAELSVQEQEDIWGKTATRVYQL
jgi:L-fuconolactonase